MRRDFLACLRDLTNAIPEDNPMYVTNLNLHESMKGAVVGKGSSDKSVLTLVQRLKSSKHFSDVKMSLDTKDAVGPRSDFFDFVQVRAAGMRRANNQELRWSFLNENAISPLEPGRCWR